MGIKLIAKDTVAPWNSKVIPPVTRGLEGWFTFDTDASRFSRNRAINKPDAEVTGSPVAFATHGRFKGLVNFLKTQIPDSTEMIIMVIGKAVSTPPTAPGGGPDSPFYAGGFTGNSVDPTVPGLAMACRCSMGLVTRLPATRADLAPLDRPPLALQTSEAMCPLIGASCSSSER